MNRSIADAHLVDSKMIEAQPARPVLLVGSVPLGSVAEVFEVVAANLGDLIRRVPDGEVGPRLEWIAWQKQTMGRATEIEIGGFREIQGGAVKYTQYKIKVGLNPEDVDFGSLGYAQAAKTSYAKFKELRDAGKIPRGVRFQVSLPTPLAVVFAFFIPSDIRKVWPVYEQRLFDEVDEIVATIPQEDLAIQWDVAVEIDGILEVPAVAKNWSKDELIDAIIRACNRVPAAVELGIHLCYGDPGHKHLVERVLWSNWRTALPPRSSVQSRGSICRSPGTVTTRLILLLCRTCACIPERSFTSGSSICAMAFPVQSNVSRLQSRSSRNSGLQPNVGLVAEIQRRSFR
jgi:hypothetical protein